jgi:pyruvate-formate lyase
MATSLEKLQLAKRHLEKVLTAWDDPTDWDDLSLYGFYCLEAAVEEAALHFGLGTCRKHWEKVDLAEALHRKKGLPDITDLLRDLNDARKAAAYGDVSFPQLDAEDISSEIEAYVDEVAAILGAKEANDQAGT